VNKKKQKNFINFGFGRFHHRAKRSRKVFWFFFSKKNFFFLGKKDGLLRCARNDGGGRASHSTANTRQLRLQPTPPRKYPNCG